MVGHLRFCEFTVLPGGYGRWRIWALADTPFSSISQAPSPLTVLPPCSAVGKSVSRRPLMVLLSRVKPQPAGSVRSRSPETEFILIPSGASCTVKFALAETPSNFSCPRAPVKFRLPEAASILRVPTVQSRSVHAPLTVDSSACSRSSPVHVSPAETRFTFSVLPLHAAGTVTVRSFF